MMLDRSLWFTWGHSLYIVVVSCIFVPIVTARPVDKLPTPDAIKFMRRFGYLEDVGPNADNLYREETMVDAIKTVQRFGNLPQTGVIDEETQKLFTKRRCGVPDVVRRQTNRTKRFILGGDGWNKRHITYFLANWSPKLHDWHRVMHHLEQAFSKWGDYARLRFSHVASSEADIVMFFARGHHGDGYPLDGPGNVLAHAFFPYEHDVFGGDIHFDEDENWIIGPGDGVDFASVAAHEIGHSLGLAHSPVSSSLMFPYYKGHLANIQLDYDDILAVYQLYVSRQLNDDQYWIPDETLTTPASDNTGRHDRNEDDTDEHSTEKEKVDENTTEDSNENIDETVNSEQEDTINEDYVQEDNTDNEIDKYFPPDDDNPEPEDSSDEAQEFPSDTDDSATSPTTAAIPTTTSTPPSIIPDMCEGSYDTVTVIRQEMFVFKGEWVWRYQSSWNLAQGYPVPFQQMFQFPERIKKIDAAYERDEDNAIVFFSGPWYWEFNGNRFIADKPRPLTDLGLPSELDGLDAAFVWAKNKKTYYFRKDQYWRYNETEKSIEPSYPQDISRWRGVPRNIDTAMKYSDGLTYFFQGQDYYRFNDQLVKVDDFYPLNAPQDWFGCYHLEEPSTTIRNNKA